MRRIAAFAVVALLLPLSVSADPVRGGRYDYFSLNSAPAFNATTTDSTHGYQLNGTTAWYNGAPLTTNDNVLINGAATITGTITAQATTGLIASSNVQINGYISGNSASTGQALSLTGWTAGTAGAGTILNTQDGVAGKAITLLENQSVIEAKVDLFGRYVTYGTAPRRTGQYQTITTADTTFTAVGLPAPTIVNGGGTCTPAADVTDTAYQMVKYPTDGTTAHSCGIGGPFTTTVSTYGPLLDFVVRTDPAAATSTRIYIGFGASDASQVATLAALNGIRGCWYRYDTTIGDTDWMAVSSDGTTASATDTTVAFASATTVVGKIDFGVAGECDFYLGGVRKVAKSTNPPAGATTMGLQASITGLAASARALSISKILLSQN